MANSIGLPVWMYWEDLPGRRMPVYLKMCIEIARAKLSGDFRLVGPDEIATLLPETDIDLDGIRLKNPRNHPIALKVDYYRAALLKEYGGIWLDVDCIVRRDIVPRISEILSEHDFWCMKKTETSGLVTNNIMGSRKNGRVISKYLEEMEARLRKKTTAGGTFDWTEIGAEMLTPVVEAHSDICFLEDEANVHPVHYADHDVFWRRDDSRSELGERIDRADVVMLYNAIFDDDAKAQTRRQLLNRNSLIGGLLREGLPDQVRVSTPAGTGASTPGKLTREDVTIIFTTTARPQSCLEFVASIRERCGDGVRILIAAQGEEYPEYKVIERQHSARILRVPEDYGLSRSRNALVDECDTDLIFLCDDDFVFDERMRLDDALSLLNQRPEITILGGLFENYYYSDENVVTGIKPTAFTHLMSREDDALVFWPVEYVERPREFVDLFAYVTKVDTVNNFALMRREIFNQIGIRWHDEIKIMGEHEHFYDQVIKNKDRIGVYYTNLLITQHHRRVTPGFSVLRERSGGLPVAMRATGVSAFEFPGKRTDVLLGQDETMRFDHQSWSLSA